MLEVESGGLGDVGELNVSSGCDASEAQDGHRQRQRAANEGRVASNTSNGAGLSGADPAGCAQPLALTDFPAADDAFRLLDDDQMIGGQIPKGFL